jgi:hypothetical protein
MYDRQADTQTDGAADLHSGREIYRLAGRHADKAGREVYKHTCRPTGQQDDQDVGRQVYGQARGLQART